MNRGRTDAVSNKDTRCRITPLSQIVNIILFAVFALAVKSFSAVLLQCMVLLLSFFLCGIGFREISFKQLAALGPVIGFVLILNFFRGTGEILLVIGPFLIVKQGILRGILYAGVIVQLWFMSKLLTIGFSERQLLKSVSSAEKTSEALGLFLMLYYILRIFHTTYGELKVFFFGTRKRLKERTVRFLVHAFERANEEYDRIEDVRHEGGGIEAGARNISKRTIVSWADLTSLSVQAGVLILAYFMKDLFTRL
ncbi:MAG: hypothetical protein JXQ30_01925 [Spirochaetes bacterium]|nr:hypothetical protein [Spirochaetota bacterium]